MKEMDEAVRRGDLASVIRLIETGIDGGNALVGAASYGHIEMVAALLSRGVPVNVHTSFGASPLIAAATQGHIATVRLLLDHGAKIEWKGFGSLTALLAAIMKDQLDIIALLLDRGASLSPDAIAMAASAGHTDILKFFSGRGADLDDTAFEGTTPLMWAAKHAHIETVRFLLEQGVNVNSRDKTGQSVLTIAQGIGLLRRLREGRQAAANRIKIINLLKMHGASE